RRDGVDGLLDDLGGLPNLLEPDPPTIPAVTVGSGYDVEVELVVREVVLDLAEIERHSRRPQVGPGDAVGGCHLRWQHTDVAGAGDQDLVVGHEILEL